jgi:hypothetical protein
MAEVLDKRWRTVLTLQQRLQKLNPGSQEAEIIEHAISLAIDSHNQEQNLTFFRYDLIRNAKFSIRRTKARQSQLWQKVLLDTPHLIEDINSYSAMELEATLRGVVTTAGKNLEQCFHDMLNDKDVAATALSCGVSQRTANRLRQKIRQIVRVYLIAHEIAY